MVPYRTQARRSPLAVRRPSSVWSVLLALGAVCSAAAMGLVCRAIAERAPTSTWLDDPAGVGQSALAVAVPVMLFCGCLKALAWLRRARIEFFEEAIRVCADSTEEVRWDEIVTLRRLFYRNLHDIAHEAGWALDTRDGRRVRIAMTYADLEPELSRHLVSRGIGVTRTDLETLDTLRSESRPPA